MSITGHTAFPPSSGLVPVYPFVMEAPVQDTMRESNSLEKFDPEKGSIREAQAVRECPLYCIKTLH